MIIRFTNKSRNFYFYLGKIFGSRDIEKVTHDRIYDDDNKDWYIYFKNNKAVAFISVVNNVIKNIWGEKDDFIIELLLKLRKDMKIIESVVTIIYKHLYQKAGYFIVEEKTKNFVKIRSDK